MAYGVPTNQISVTNAFSAAETLDFKLFFSFDYAGNGSWPQSQVISFLHQFSTSPAYYHFSDRPFVSTFEGPDSADDWIAIKNQTGCFFVPDWSSVGVPAALELAGGIADGLFSWAAWPTEAQRMNTYVDAAYIDCLKRAKKPYMMPVSPWFYTNMPQYDKNWAFYGDDLWYDRWIEVAFLEPEWIEIISWNDYGESHYIGPLNDKGYGMFTAGKAPYNYARDMPHDGWRLHLPFVIDLYKKGTASLTEESLVVWYRIQPRSACSGGNTTGFAALDRQVEKAIDSWLEDKIFFSALLKSKASVTVSIGDSKNDARWEYEPDGGIGIYHGSFAYDPDNLGKPIVTVLRDDKETVRVSGRSLSTNCASGFANYNAWVGSETSGATISPVSPDLPISKQVCIEGSGNANFSDLCEFTCKYGYCPLDTCTCTAMGAAKDKPKATKVKGYPKHGNDSYEGLCSFSCYYGSCPKKYCSSTETTHTSSPASPTCKDGNQVPHSSDCAHKDDGQRQAISFVLFGFCLIISVCVWQGSFP
ncbi:hypothetical protein N7532_007819 [Penicillium argentinense]|uniref:Uncharacterized protein n=1 Tax=Penicillium argentinense TaxID=1131581 RepID=A0A9W9EWH3_9EURO|nr:uncharacterized protein N7532_007819 [Penicillium argentinense]KAJ5089135.1 hypothetical protein N7532_007819 [Penicillium argentinense]